MKFSIVIPLYNGAKFIRATLDSVLAQSYKNYEVILVNDESPDNVGDVVKEYITSHKDIDFTYLEQKNKGLGGARNTAIRHACGDVIAILDQDDIWYPEKLAEVATIYRQYPAVAVVCHNQNIRRQGKISGQLVNGPAAEDMHRRLLFKGNCLSTSATTFRRSVIRDIGYFSEDVNRLHFVEDYEFWLKVALNGYKFFFSNNVMGEYVIHGSNFTNYELTCKGELWVVNLHFKQLKIKKLSDYFYLRKRRSESLYTAAYRSLFERRLFGKGALYLIKAVGDNPFLLYRVARRFLKLAIKGS